MKVYKQVYPQASEGWENYIVQDKRRTYHLGYHPAQKRFSESSENKRLERAGISLASVQAAIAE